MPVVSIGQRRVIDSGSFLIADGEYEACVEVHGIKYWFMCFLSQDFPTGNFTIDQDSAGRFVFMGALDSNGHVWRFFGVGMISGKYFDLDVKISCVANQQAVPAVFSVEYTFVYQTQLNAALPTTPGGGQ